MGHDWKTAFLAQAHSDYLMYRRLNAEADIPKCHMLHYLQMFTEKAAKSSFTDGAAQPVEDHRVLVRFLKISQQNKMMRSRWGRGARDFERTLAGLIASATWIESLAPRKSSQAPNPEYPWLARREEPARSGSFVEEVLVPTEFDFQPLSARQAPKLVKLVEFVEWYFRLNRYPTPGQASTRRPGSEA